MFENKAITEAGFRTDEEGRRLYYPYGLKRGFLVTTEDEARIKRFWSSQWATWFIFVGVPVIVLLSYVKPYGLEWSLAIGLILSALFLVRLYRGLGRLIECIPSINRAYSRSDSFHDSMKKYTNRERLQMALLGTGMGCGSIVFALKERGFRQGFFVFAGALFCIGSAIFFYSLMRHHKATN